MVTGIKAREPLARQSIVCCVGIALFPLDALSSPSRSPTPSAAPRCRPISRRCSRARSRSIIRCRCRRPTSAPSSTTSTAASSRWRRRSRSTGSASPTSTGCPSSPPTRATSIAATRSRFEHVGSHRHPVAGTVDLDRQQPRHHRPLVLLEHPRFRRQLLRRAPERGPRDDRPRAPPQGGAEPGARRPQRLLAVGRRAGSGQPDRPQHQGGRGGARDLAQRRERGAALAGRGAALPAHPARPAAAARGGAQPADALQGRSRPVDQPATRPRLHPGDSAGRSAHLRADRRAD